jgi:uncharacterized membrane protein YedE/YeeE
MSEMMLFLQQPWPWYVAGPLIGLILFLMLYFGKTFGISSSFRTTCAMIGAGKLNSFFRLNWREQMWNLVFVAGTLVGGYIAATWLQSPEAITLNPETVANLKQLGITAPGKEYLPSDMFSWEALFTLKGFIILVGGGFLVGFGARYADGCTSGHAIAGLSNLQMPSLIAVIGFFIGGLIMTYGVLPYLLNW